MTESTSGIACTVCLDATWVVTFVLLWRNAMLLGATHSLVAASTYLARLLLLLTH